MTEALQEQVDTARQDEELDQQAQADDVDSSWDEELDDDGNPIESADSNPPAKTDDDDDDPPVKGDPKPEAKQDDKPESADTPPAKTAEEAAAEKAKQREEEERQRELDRYLKEQREREQANRAGQPLSPAQLVEQAIKDDDFEITAPDSESGKVKASEFAKQYPGVAEFAAHIAHKMVGGEVGRLQSVIDQMQVEKNAESMLSALSSDAHGIDNARDLAGSAEFWAFVDGLTPNLQKLADSNQADDVATVMRLYNEKTGHQAAGEAGQSAEEARSKNASERERQNKLHKGTLRNRRQPPPTDNLTPEEQADKAWSEDLDDDD